MCSCQQFYTEGYVCSHILAAMHVVGIINVSALMSDLGVVRTGGRPLKRLKALHKMSPIEAVSAETPMNFIGQLVLSPSNKM